MRTGPVFLLGFILTAGPAPAQPTIHGRIEALDIQLGTITLLVPPRAEPRQFSLSRPDLPATNALGEPLKLADLRVKQRVALMLNDADDVAAIRLDDNCLWAPVIKVEPTARQLTIKHAHALRILKVPADVAILRDGETISLADLKVGPGIKAVFGPDQQLRQIHTGKGIASASPYYRWVLEAGVVLKVDPQKKNFRVVNYLEPIRVRDYEILPDAILRLIHSSYLLRTTDRAGLHEHCKVNFCYESDSKKVAQVTAYVPTLVRRRVEKIDGAKRLLTLMVDDKTTTYPVADDAMIRKPRGLADWHEVAAGQLVTCGLSLDRREIVYIYLWER